MGRSAGVMNINRRIDSVLARLLYRCSPAISQPIFIVSAPRSGSSYLYEAFREIHGLYSFEKENDPMWWRFFPYSRLDVPSDYIKKQEVNQSKVKDIQIHLLKELMTSKKRTEMLLNSLFSREPLRYVEKTIANCFHLEAIEQLFPDALFIHLVRDGRACISSMMEGWNSGFFWERPLPFSSNASVAHWTYPIPPGWQNVEEESLEEICAWSWIEHNRYILERYNQSESFRDRYMRITYERLVENPIEIISSILEFSGLQMSQECIDYLGQKNVSWTTISTPKTDKWREVNFNQISNVLPTISPFMKELGYSV